MGITDIENLDKIEMICPQNVLKKSDVRLDVCIIDFSQKIMSALIDDGIVELVDDSTIKSVSCDFPVYRVKDTNVGVIKTTVGAPIATGLMEEVAYCFDCDKFVLFGSCGTLDKNIGEGAIIVPDKAFRDEGVSYHYLPPSDYIVLPNSKVVTDVFDRLNVDYVVGATWTTDAFYRETKAKFDKVKADGCVAVEMEIAACQAVADYRGAELYAFLYRGDNLDADSWDCGALKNLPIDERLKHFYLALEIAMQVSGCRVL